MRRLIRGLALATVTPFASIDTMVADLADGMRRRGAHLRVLLIASNAPNQRLLDGLVQELAQAEGPRFLLDVDGKVDLTLPGPDGAPRSVHDLLDLPRVTMLEGHPAHHQDHLLKLPRDSIVTVIDPFHRDYLTDIGLAAREIVTMPHAGPDPVPAPIPMADRSIDVLFAGNVGAIEPPEIWAAGRAAGDDRRAECLLASLAAMRAGPVDGYATLKRQAAAHGLPADAFTLRADLIALERYFNDAMRHEMLQALARLPARRRVVVMGDVAPSALAGVKATILGTQPFTKLLELMADARLTLNAMPFRGGAHERIFYGLSRGSVSLTVSTELLTAEAVAGAGVVFLKRGAPAIAAQIEGLLGASRLGSMQADGIASYSSRHTWLQRADDLLAAVNRHWRRGD